MTTGPGPQGEGVDDFITQRLRARGLFGAERGRSQTLWLPEVALTRVRRWVGEAFPGPIAALHHGSADDVRFTGDEVSALVVADGRWLRVTTYVHDGGFLHAVALRAAEAGVASLALDEDSFYGRAPFLALTEYRPGEAPRTEWLDPLRGLAPDAGRVQAWLATYLGERRPFLDWVLDTDRGVFGRPAASFTLTRHGEPLPVVRWVQHTPEPANEPVPNVQVVFSEEEARELPVGPAERAVTAASAGAALVVLSLSSIAVCVLGAGLVGAQTWSDALVVSGACAVLVGWMALLPLRWPSGRRVPWAARLAWFGALPVVVPLVMYLAGGTT